MTQEPQKLPYPHDTAGGPAFPFQMGAADALKGSGRITLYGISARDYFAAHALAACLASRPVSWNLPGYTAQTPGTQFAPFHIPTPEEAAQRAYAVADAMLKAREAKS